VLFTRTALASFCTMIVMDDAEFHRNPGQNHSDLSIVIPRTDYSDNEESTSSSPAVSGSGRRQKEDSMPALTMELLNFDLGSGDTFHTPTVHAEEVNGASSEFLHPITMPPQAKMAPYKPSSDSLKQLKLNARSPSPGATRPPTLSLSWQKPPILTHASVPNAESKGQTGNWFFFFNVCVLCRPCQLF